MFKWRHMKRIVTVGCAAGLACTGVVVWRVSKLRSASVITVSAETDNLNESYPDRSAVPSRADLLKKLKTEKFDVLVIGGGATGAGVVLDSQTRGLNTALVEKYDFASATSSRSTKLVHGGVRYLQAAVMGLDYEQYKMVEEALSERANVLAVAPHLAYHLPILLPVKEWWLVPYYWAGVKTYDLVSGRQRLAPSYYIGKKKALSLFPMLKDDDLTGALVYYDGGLNDARMCLSVVLTAIRFGAAALNYVSVTQLVKHIDEKTKKPVVSGAKCRDMMTGEEFVVAAKCVINATGPFTDAIRGMDDSSVTPITQPSAGVHITLPGYYSPSNFGLLDPNTSDGRVVFFLPWQNHTVAGTTDQKCTVESGQFPSEASVQFLLREIQGHLSQDIVIRRGDVLSTWSGIRPLVKNPNAKDTKSLARNHIIEVSRHNMITIAGGKWTTYRKMAEETVDKAIEVCNLEPKSLKSRTVGLMLEGAHRYSPTLHIKLVQDYGLSTEIAEHLATTYGDKAFRVARRCGLTGYKFPLIGNRIHPNHIFVDGEVIYAVQREYALTAIDVISRRLRLAFLNADNANESLETVVGIMAKYLNWDSKKIKNEIEHTRRYLRREMGLELAQRAHAELLTQQQRFSEEDELKYSKLFGVLDKENKGFLTMLDLKKMFTEHNDIGERVSTDKLSEILAEVDTNKNGCIEKEEFLNLMYRLKTGSLTTNRFAIAAKLISEKPGIIPVERSGGGL